MSAAAPSLPARPGPTLPAGRFVAVDGFRGLGVIGVITYHFGWSALSGGWFFLDGFFVASGFVITLLLLGPSSSSAASPASVLRFWGRRAKRLLPSAALVVAVVCFTARWWADPARLDALRVDAAAALGYVANWRFAWSSTAYDGPVTAASPLLHTWTLSMEEQFYLCWPLVVLACRRFASRPAVAVGVIAAAAAVASGVAMEVLFDPADPWRVYFASHTRGFGLALGSLAGALVFCGVPARAPRLVRAAGWAALAVLVGAAATWQLGDESLPGLPMFAAVAAVAVLGLAVAVPGPVTSALSSAPLVAVGRWSYVLYLWHWPAVVVLNPASTGLDGGALFALRAVCTVVAAGAARVLVERPVMGFGARRAAVATVSLVGLAAVAAVTVPVGAAGAGTSARTVAAPPGEMVSVLAVGDSMAGGVADELVAAAGDGVAVSTLSASVCGWAARDVAADVSLPGVEECAALRERRAAAAARADVVVAFSASEMLDRFDAAGDRLVFGSAAADEAVLAEMGAAHDELTRSGAALVVVLNPPPSPAAVVPAVGPNDPVRFAHLERLTRRFAERHPDVVLVELDELVCGGVSPCPAKVDGVALRAADGRHLSPVGARAVAPVLLDAAVGAATGRR